MRLYGEGRVRSVGFAHLLISEASRVLLIPIPARKKRMFMRSP